MHAWRKADYQHEQIACMVGKCFRIPYLIFAKGRKSEKYVQMQKQRDNELEADASAIL